MADTAAPESRAFVVVPEPTDWLHPVLGALRAQGPVEVFAPWVLPNAVVTLGKRVGFVRRRQGHGLPGARGRGWFTAAELLARAVARGKTAQTLANRVHMRTLVDAMAAHHLARASRPSLVIAPSLAARRTFSRARAAGSTCLLIEDLPDFDSLVDGLDGLALALPEATFLRNHRPRTRDHARQRAERWQADVIGVRGRVGWHRLGAGTPRVLIPRADAPVRHVAGDDIAFAGPPLARAGSTHLPALLDALPGRVVRVQPGPVAEPPALLEHPRVRVDRSLDGVGVVLSLAPLESYPSSVAAALDRGIPVVGTLASTGILEPATVLDIDPSDVERTAAAVERALRGQAVAPHAWTPPLPLRGWLEGRRAGHRPRNRAGSG